MTVASDTLTGKNWEPMNRGKGDAFMVAGATLYGFANATEEYLVRKRPLYEVVGQMGFWGVIICGCQAAGLEHDNWMVSSWNGVTIGLIVAYTAGE
jgi:solute carrier family 35, member F1/2